MDKAQECKIWQEEFRIQRVSSSQQKWVVSIWHSAGCRRTGGGGGAQAGVPPRCLGGRAARSRSGAVANQLLGGPHIGLVLIICFFNQYYWFNSCEPASWEVWCSTDWSIGLVLWSGCIKVTKLNVTGNGLLPHTLGSQGLYRRGE